MLAGCLGGDGGAGDLGGPDIDDYDGTTLIWYLASSWLDGNDAAWATWFGTGAYPGPGNRDVGDGRWALPGEAWDATMARGLWGPWVNHSIRTGDRQLGLYADVEIAPDEMVVTVREDAGWSNGDPVRGRDVAPLTMAARLASQRPLADAPDDDPDRPIDAVTGVEWSDRTARLVSEGDWFGTFMDQELWGLVTRLHTARQDGGATGGVVQHTGLTPYDAWFDRLVGLWEAAQDGDTSLWTGDATLIGELVEALPAPPGDSWYEHFHDPANCAVTGAFTPARIDPQLIVLEPNPHFYAADRVSVDHVLFPVRRSMEFQWLALESGQRDYLRREVLPETADSAPDNMEQRRVPAPSGLALAVNHQTPPYDDRTVRQAIYYAIDTAQIAENANPARYDGVTTPGAHPARAGELLDESFVADTLTTYPFDTDRAAERMEAAGYRRTEGTWVDGDGTTVEVPIAIRGPDDSVALSVDEQLSSFGLATTEVDAERDPAGRRPAAWSIREGAGVMFPAVGRLYAWLVELEERAREFGVVPMDQIEAADYEAGTGVLTGGIDAFTIEAPPVGEPDGPLRSWSAPRLARTCARAGSREEYVETLETLAWLYNWHLPVLPIANAAQQHFVNVADWDWTDFDYPTTGVGVDRLQPADLVALGRIRPR